MSTAAVIGCGDVSIVHLEAIETLATVELVGVCDVDPAAAERAAGRFGVPAFADHRELIEQTGPDVVHVTTPHDQHVPVALDCLAAGVHVLVEKPVAATVAEGERLAAAAEARPEVKAGICFQNRYNVTAERARELLSSGELGQVLGGHGAVFWYRPPAYYEARPWRGRMATSGGGVLINQAIHTLDLLQWLVGDVTGVSGHVGRTARAGGEDVEDYALLALEHAGGAAGVFSATNANVTDSPITLEIETEAARLTLRGDLTVRYRDGRTEVLAEQVTASSGRAYWGFSHQKLIADFHARLGDAEPFWISPREGLKTLEVIEAAQGLRTDLA